MPRRASKKDIQGAIQSQIPTDQLPFVYDENAPRIYTDGVRMMASPFGVTLTLSQVEIGPEGQPRARHVGTLYMSNEHADALIEALTIRKEAQAKVKAQGKD